MVVLVLVLVLCMGHMRRTTTTRMSRLARTRVVRELRILLMRRLALVLLVLVRRSIRMKVRTRAPALALLTGVIITRTSLVELASTPPRRCRLMMLLTRIRASPGERCRIV